MQKVIRIGKSRNDGRHRPVLVVLGSEADKFEILKSAKKLKFERNPPLEVAHLNCPRPHKTTEGTRVQAETRTQAA